MAEYGKSGGLGYHLAALLYARKAWHPFRKSLGTELVLRLRKFTASSNHILVIVGPSGGYCLDSAVLRGWKAIYAVDVDPWAERIFKRRHASVIVGQGFKWLRQDFFRTLETYGGSLQKWSLQEIGQNKNLVFLFLNVLGQMEFIYSDTECTRLDKVLVEAFRRAPQEGMFWVSVHDRISYAVPRGEENKTEVIGVERILTDDELADRFRSPREIETHRLGAWQEYAIGGHTYMPWRLTAKSIQIAELSANL